MLGGGATAALGSLLLWGLVQTGVTRTTAFAVQLAATMVVNFIYNSRWTFNGCDKASLRRTISLFVIVSVTIQVGRWIAYRKLVDNGMHYELANALCLASGGLISFYACNRWVFKSGAPDRQSAALAMGRLQITSGSHGGDKQRFEETTLSAIGLAAFGTHSLGSRGPLFVFMI